MKPQNNNHHKFSKAVENKEKRKIKERRKSKYPVLRSIGMFGLIGWSIVAPTLLGTFFGVWLDEQYPSKHSWTLTFLITGLIVGCMGAWYWLSKEKKDIQKEEEDANE